MNAPLRLLNDLTPAEFLSEYWQKKPLLIRGAIPHFKGLLSPNELAGLACEDDVQARIIQNKRNKWSVKNGPFDDADFAKLPPKDWTLLVQSVNHFLPEAADLLAQFNFIPHARLDDLMVSYAPNGGGVGAHFDSYDVFLLQGSGQRRWQISAQADLTLVDGAPIKILQDFKPEQEWLLEAGDMLYLPPQYAHCGTAVGDDCMTYSIGFRAPKTQELQHEFLSYLQDNLSSEGLYGDPDLEWQNHPAEIGENMVEKVSEMLRKITWSKQNIAGFLGHYLTEPKPDVVFAPNKKISAAKFAEQLKTHLLKLDFKSQMLFYQQDFYLNGEKLAASALAPQASVNAALKALADTRKLDLNHENATTIAALADLLYPAYLEGYVELS